MGEDMFLSSAKILLSIFPIYGERIVLAVKTLSSDGDIIGTNHIKVLSFELSASVFLYILSLSRTAYGKRGCGKVKGKNKPGEVI